MPCRLRILQTGVSCVAQQAKLHLALPSSRAGHRGTSAVKGRPPARGSYLPMNGTRVTTRRGYHRDGPEVVFGGSTGIDLHCPTRTCRVMGREQDPVHVTVPQIAPFWPLVDGCHVSLRLVNRPPPQFSQPEFARRMYCSPACSWLSHRIWVQPRSGLAA